MRAADVDAAAAWFAGAPPLRLDMAAVCRQIWRRYTALTRRLRVIYTDTDPYADQPVMRAEWATGTLYVYAGYNEALPRDVHLALRAIHDNDHCEADAGFDAGGEWRAVRVAAAREPQLACLWSSEILGQVCTFLARGAFPAHRLVAGMNHWLDDLSCAPCVTP